MLRLSGFRDEILYINNTKFKIMLCNFSNPANPNDTVDKVGGIANNQSYKFRNPFRSIKSCFNDNIRTSNSTKNRNNNGIQDVIWFDPPFFCRLGSYQNYILRSSGRTFQIITSFIVL